MIFTMYAISCKAQQTALSDTVSINLPAKTKKLNKEEFVSSFKNRFNYSKMAINGIAAAGTRIDNKHFYVIDNVLVSLAHGKRPFPIQLDFLQKAKKGIDGLNNLSPF